MQTRYTSADQWAEAKDGVIPAPYALEAVSYTHLTLPTTSRV